jgi:5-methylcytosine-specific restriction endonuclease McrA
MQVLERDNHSCTRCGARVDETCAHIDHIRPISSVGGTNQLSNLRVLCRRCHVLRADGKHRGMIASALRDGVIDSNWRTEVWD